MAGKARFRRRLRYWFDNTMSRGTAALVGWLGLVTAILIVAVTAGLAFVAPPDDDGRPPNPFKLLWETFVSTFSLSGIPASGPIVELALWFILALGGIFIVSALVGLLTS